MACAPTAQAGPGADDAAGVRPAVVRRAAGWVIVLAIAVNVGMAAWFRFPPPIRRAVHGLAEVTGGVVQPLLVLHACLLLVVVGGIIIGLGRLRPADLGLRARGILPAALLAAGLWGVMQVYVLIAAGDAGQAGGWHSQWVEAPGAAAGEMLGNWLGVALYEELVFRGFLLTQLGLQLARVRRMRRPVALVAALLVSAAVFAAGHLPYLQRQHTAVEQLPADLGLLFGYGVVFGLVYLWSGNLWCNIAVHGLVLAPGMLMASGEPAQAVLVPAVICWLVGAGLWRGLRSRLRPGDRQGAAGGAMAGRGRAGADGPL